MGWLYNPGYTPNLRRSEFILTVGGQLECILTESEGRWGLKCARVFLGPTHRGHAQTWNNVTDPSMETTNVFFCLVCVCDVPYET